MRYSEKTSARMNALNKLERSSVWIEHPIITIGVVLLLAMADGLNLWAAFDKVLTESIGVLIGIVVAFALCLEGIPVLIARLMKDVQYYGWSWFKKTMLILLVCGFLTVFGFAADVKIETRDLMFSTASAAMVSTAASNTTTVLSSDVKDRAYLAATIAMAALPLATSILAFYLGWLSSDPVKAEARKYRLFIARSKERLADIVAAHAELGTPEARRAQLIKRENELYADALQQNAAEEGLAKAVAVEAFFEGKDADSLTLITSRKTTETRYQPKTSSLADTEDTPEPSAPCPPSERLMTIPVQRNS